MDGLNDIANPVGTAGKGAPAAQAFARVIDEICGLDWESVSWREVGKIAHAYYYFSIQFRENLEAACRLRPQDEKLQALREGECDTDNLSPWPGVARPGERLNHDEFMRRLLLTGAVEPSGQVAQLGGAYIEMARSLDDTTRAISIASYEDGGLTRVFSAMLRAPDWAGAVAGGFRYFLEQHILFDSDDGGGHGSLSRHLRPDDRIVPLWLGFKELLQIAVPALARPPAAPLPSAASRPKAQSSTGAASVGEP